MYENNIRMKADCFRHVRLCAMVYLYTVKKYIHCLITVVMITHFEVVEK